MTISFIRLARLSVPIFLVLGVIIAVLLYNSPRNVLDYDEQEWQGDDLKALRILEGQIELAMGEVCDPLPCWLVMEVETIEVLQQPKLKQVLGKYIYFLKTADNQYDNKTLPIGSRVITTSVHQQWWSKVNCYLEGKKVKFVLQTLE